jgi:hypothetical protein
LRTQLGGTLPPLRPSSSPPEHPAAFDEAQQGHVVGRHDQQLAALDDPVSLLTGLANDHRAHERAAPAVLAAEHDADLVGSAAWWRCCTPRRAIGEPERRNMPLPSTTRLASSSRTG